MIWIPNLLFWGMHDVGKLYDINSVFSIDIGGLLAILHFLYFPLCQAFSYCKDYDVAVLFP
jgi:hypothetical protein